MAGRWRERGRGGTPAAYRLGDHTGRHFAKGVALQAPAQGSPGREKEPGEGGGHGNFVYSFVDSLSHDRIEAESDISVDSLSIFRSWHIITDMCIHAARCVSRLFRFVYINV